VLRQVGLREPRGQKLLDLGLALVSGGGQQLLSALGRQVRSQHYDRAQVQAAIRHGREQGGEPPCRPGCVNALEGGFLGEPQLVDTIRVHRRMRRRHVELPRVELGDMREKVCGGGAIACRGRSEIARQGGVGNVAQ